MARKRESHHQLELPIKLRGGRRRGAGRKQKAERRQVSHRARRAVSKHCPLHVTVRLKKALPSLRCAGARKALNAAFKAGCEKFGFRLVHFSIQSNHLHLLVEADNKRALSRGMQGLLIRMARKLNGLWRRKGRVFSDRYHSRILRTPREVRTALVYVLQNARKHGVKLSRSIDTFSSGLWFDGWRKGKRILESLHQAAPVAGSRSWLLGTGWRRHGLSDPQECPRIPC